MSCLCTTDKLAFFVVFLLHHFGMTLGSGEGTTFLLCKYARCLRDERTGVPDRDLPVVWK